MPSNFDMAMADAKPAFDETFGDLVVYTPPGGSPVDVVALWKWLDQAFRSEDSTLRTARAATVRVPAFSVSDITRGARFAYGGGVFEIVREATRNAAYIQLEVQEIVTIERHADGDGIARGF